MNTFFVKVKGRERPLTIKTACTTTFTYQVEFQWEFRVKDREGIPAVLPSDVEYVEYSCQSIIAGMNGVRTAKFRSVAKKWSKALLLSRFGAYLDTDKHGLVRYRFTLHEPTVRMIFLVSLIRFMEEKIAVLDKFLKVTKTCDPDMLLALYCIGHQVSSPYTSNHVVYQPYLHLEGIMADDKSYDEFISLMVADGTTSCLEAITGSRFAKFPKDAIEGSREKIRPSLEGVTEKSLIRFLVGDRN